MSLLPKNKLQRINYVRSKIAVWTANASEIGMSIPEIEALDLLVTDAEAKMALQTSAVGAARDAVSTCDLAVRAMSKKTMELVKQVRAKATTAGDDVYPLAGLPVPSVPSPIAPPEAPSDYKVELFGDGSLKIMWKCDTQGAQGTTYRIYRRLGASGPCTYLAGSGVRDYTDTSIPAGTTQVMYKIQGVRSTATGAWSTFNVFFGSNEAGMATATVTAGESQPKLAA